MSSESLRILADLCGSIASCGLQLILADQFQLILADQFASVFFLANLCGFKLIFGSMVIRWCARKYSSQPSLPFRSFKPSGVR